MVDKITSWKYTEDFVTESPAIAEARARAEELGIECITPSVGSHLALLASALGAKAIVEAGTGAGVSALWLLSASKDSILATIDSEPEFQVAAKLAFKDAKIAPTRTRIISGKAIDVM
jgi:predicted O-methyltransferase YrrM